MKHIVKPKIPQKYFMAILLAALLVLLIVTAVIVNAAFDKNGSGGDEPSEIPEVFEGEGRQDGIAIAYPKILKDMDISYIKIKNEKGQFGFFRYENEKYLTLFYTDENGEDVVYYPDVCDEDENFTYTDIYKVETNDGFSYWTYVDYLCMTLETPYYGERIVLDSDEAVKKLQLEEYGFADGASSTVAFEYTDALGNKVYRTVTVGDKTSTGTGYYFMVDDRPCVYTSLSNYYDYTLCGISEYLNPILISEGLEEDNGYEPYLTTGYYQWINKVHDIEGDIVTDGSRVVVYIDVTGTDDTNSTGYINTGYDLVEIDLEKYKDSVSYRRMISAIVGKSVGVQDENIVFTVTSNSRLVDFGNSQTVTYTYTVTAVESIITDDREIFTPGTTAGANNLIKVTYSAAANGKKLSEHPQHAVIDLSRMPEEAAGVLRNTPVGELSKSEYVTFDIDYSKDNATVVTSSYTITEIIAIYNQKGELLDKVTEDSIVSYRYTVYINGVASGEASFVLDLASVKDEGDLKIKEALIGLKASKNLSISFDENRVYYEHFMTFKTYEISRIDRFITSEMVVAFKFQNASERDPYYGETYYQNLLTDERKLYGLNAGACETLVMMLGGLSDENATGTASGLIGNEVVAVGLTPEIMKKYGLYAHTIYFELPRGIKSYQSDKFEGELDPLDDYTYLDTLGFTLYISEVDPVTNTRYVASDLYDVVVTVPREKFVFLDYDFVSFWARRHIFIMGISDISDFAIEFNLSDLKGKYDFELLQPATSAAALGVYVTASGECTPTNKLVEYLAKKGYDGTSLKEFYINCSTASAEEHKAASPDSLGVYCFRDAMRMIFLTGFVDLMPESERDKALATESVMTISVKLEEDSLNASPYVYVYEFYRADDRRVLVSIHQETEGGTVITKSVADFYISTFAFKKIVNNFVGVLNAEVIDTEIGYIDGQKKD